MLHTRPPMRVLLVHGEQDRIVPPTAMHAAKATLQRAGYPVESVLSRGGHRITASAVERIGDWMRARA
jgi:predicted esterase